MKSGGTLPQAGQLAARACLECFEGRTRPVPTTDASVGVSIQSCGSPKRKASSPNSSSAIGFTLKPSPSFSPRPSKNCGSLASFNPAQVTFSVQRLTSFVYFFRGSSNLFPVFRLRRKKTDRSQKFVSPQKPPGSHLCDPRAQRFSTFSLARQRPSCPPSSPNSGLTYNSIVRAMVRLAMRMLCRLTRLSATVSPASCTPNCSSEGGQVVDTVLT